jgi:hypothetical protein
MKSIRLRCGLYALVLTTAIFVACTCAALPQAQQNEKDVMPPSVDQQLSTLNAKLNLTAEQQAKIRAILEEQQQQSQEAATDGNTLSREDRRSNVRRIGVATSARIREVLNDDQKVKFDQMEKKATGS